MSSSLNGISLRELVRSRLLDSMVQSVNAGKENLFVVLICDSITLPLVSNALSSADLVNNRIAVVDRLEKGREPLMNMEAIYFISPTPQNMKLLLCDFPDLSKYKPKYRKHHVFLNQTCTEECMTLLTLRKDAVKRISTFVELHLDFIARDDRIFHFNEHMSLNELFPRKPPHLVEFYAERLLSVFASLKDAPSIRFQKDTVDNWCSELAFALQTEVDQYWAQQTKGPNTKPCTCLLLDRGFDPTAPFIHDFGYEALSFDLCGGRDNPSKEINTKNDTFSYDTTTTDGEALSKHVTLNDPLWRALRYLSVVEAKDIVMAQMIDLKENNEVSKFMKKEAEGEETEATARLLRQLPAYQEKVTTYGTQLSLATRVMKQIQDTKLTKIGLLEQDIATAIDPDGDPVNCQKMMVALAQTLMDPKISEFIKCRVLLLYLLNMKGVTKAHRRKMLATAGLSTEMKHLLENVLNFGWVDDVEAEESADAVHTTRVPVEEQLCCRDRIYADRKSEKPSSTLNFQKELNRFRPRLRLLLEKICTESLDTENFPFARHPSSSGVVFGRQPSSKRPRIVVFIIGGITYSEQRVATEMMKKYNVDIFLGSANMLNPGEMVSYVKTQHAVHHGHAKRGDPGSSMQRGPGEQYAGSALAAGVGIVETKTLKAPNKKAVTEADDEVRKW